MKNPATEIIPAENASPVPENGEVLVLGVMASGKTTFLSVLGHAFEKTGLFGLGLTAVGDTRTREFVEEMWRRMTRNDLDERDFPPATPEESATLLSWNVEVGAECLFRLSTLDCAGETVRKVFSHSAGSRGGASRGADRRGNPFVEAGPDGAGRSPESRLRGLAERASVLCLFIRPEDLVAGLSGDAAEDRRRRTRDIVDTVLAVTSGPLGKGRKLLFVLTDSGRHSEWTSRFHEAGGAKQWLFSTIPELERSRRARAANAIVVSAVPQTVRHEGPAGTKEIPATSFRPEGLETFLLSVGGLVHPTLEPLGAGLRAMEDARSAYFDAVSVGGASDCRRRHELAVAWHKSSATWTGAARHLLESADAISAGTRADTERFVSETTLEAERWFALETSIEKELVRIAGEKKEPPDGSPVNFKELSERIVCSANEDLSERSGAEPFSRPEEGPAVDPARDPRLPASTDPWWENAVAFYRNDLAEKERSRAEAEAKRNAEVAEAEAKRKAEIAEQRGCLVAIGIIIVVVGFLVWKGFIEETWSTCRECRGTGRVKNNSWWPPWGDDWKTCPSCDGKGGYYETWFERQ